MINVYNLIGPTLITWAQTFTEMDCCLVLTVWSCYRFADSAKHLPVCVRCSVQPQYPGGFFQLISPTVNPAQNHTQPAVNHSAHFLFSDTNSAHRGCYTCVYHSHLFSHNFSSQSQTLYLPPGGNVITNSRSLLRCACAFRFSLSYMF